MGKNSSKTVRSNVYGNTTTVNPYAYAKTDNSGTVAGFQKGTALNSVYDFVNNSIDSLLDEYLNPSLNSTTNQAKMNSFTNTLSQQSRNNLENNIINPLSKRNMIRSSQATDMYKNLNAQNVSAIADFANQLLSSSQDNTAQMLTNLLSYYMLGANYLSSMQNQSLQTSKGNATQYSETSVQNGSADLLNKLAATALDVALKKAGV